MTATTTARLAPLLLAIASACRPSPPARFYTLDAMAVPGGTAATYGVTVGPVSLPAAVNRPQFVLQVAQNRVVVDEFNRWAAPLDDAIAHAVAANLATLLGTPRVSTTPPATFVPAYRVVIAVQRFESTPGDGVTVEAVWVVRTTAKESTGSGRTVARESAGDDSFDALAAAHSRAFARVSEDIAAAIRAAASAAASR